MEVGGWIELPLGASLSRGGCAEHRRRRRGGPATTGLDSAPAAWPRPATPREILDVNRRYHDVAADDYDAKWGIDFGAAGRAQVLGKLRKLLGPQPGPFAALAGDRRRHRLLLAQPAAGRRRRRRRRARTSRPACCRARGATRAGSASTSRRSPATPPRCRSRTRRSTSCSAMRCCTTCPTLEPRSPSSAACCGPAARCSSPASRRATATASRRWPKRAGHARRAAVAHGRCARGPPATARQRRHAATRGRRARARVGRRRPRLRPRPTCSALMRGAGFDRRARPRRGAARELVRLVQPHARGERAPRRHPVAVVPVRLPRLPRAPARRPRAARAAPARRRSSTT